MVQMMMVQGGGIIRNCTSIPNEKSREMVLKDLSFFFMLLEENTAYMVLVIILKIHCFPLPIL
jgi:hypothetical protein